MYIDCNLHVLPQFSCLVDLVGTVADITIEVVFGLEERVTLQRGIILNCFPWYNQTTMQQQLNCRIPPPSLFVNAHGLTNDLVYITCCALRIEGMAYTMNQCAHGVSVYAQILR